MNFLKLTQEKLSLDLILDLVSSPTCGASSFFVGTTRDNFGEKKVLSLEYEAYENMALKAMEELCSKIRDQWNTVENIAIYHRLGNVPVKEASVIIAVSSPHRAEAMKATEWCIDNLKKTVTIWKKEIYEGEAPEWKENKELSTDPPSPESKPKRMKLDIKQEVNVPFVPPHQILIKASSDEINRRIKALMDRKRKEVNVNNISEFCSGDRNSEFSCARVDAKLRKRKDAKGHLQVDRVLNTHYHRDQTNSDYLTKYIPPNGVEERLQSLECQLSLTTPTPRKIYARLKLIEDRLEELESLSPEYINFWDKVGNKSFKLNKKKIWSLEEIQGLIKDVEKRKAALLKKSH